jgi:hypothetical protein
MKLLVFFYVTLNIETTAGHSSSSSVSSSSSNCSETSNLEDEVIQRSGFHEPLLLALLALLFGTTAALFLFLWCSPDEEDEDDDPGDVVRPARKLFTDASTFQLFAANISAPSASSVICVISLKVFSRSSCAAVRLFGFVAILILNNSSRPKNIYIYMKFKSRKNKLNPVSPSGIITLRLIET